MLPYKNKKMNNPPGYRKVKERAEYKVVFYIHLSVYVSVVFLLLVINLSISQEGLWFKWPMLVWGIGVVIHALVAFAFAESFSANERMI